MQSYEFVNWTPCSIVCEFAHTHMPRTSTSLTRNVCSLPSTRTATTAPAAGTGATRRRAHSYTEKHRHRL
eukprot:972114-Pleurochrysis_carterae.AAC.9